jgi:hypothetical protein
MEYVLNKNQIKDINARSKIRALVDRESDILPSVDDIRNTILSLEPKIIDEMEPYIYDYEYYC